MDTGEILFNIPHCSINSLFFYKCNILIDNIVYEIEFLLRVLASIYLAVLLESTMQRQIKTLKYFKNASKSTVF